MWREAPVAAHARRGFSSFVLVCCLVLSTASAQQTFTSEADFLAATPPLSMESFEGLTPENAIDQHSSLPLTDFTVSTLDAHLSVWDIPFNGGHATDGNNFVRHSGAPIGIASNYMTLTFNASIFALGINITDWGDFGTAGTLTYTDDAGGNHQVAVTPQANEAELFFGIVSLLPITSATLAHDSEGEGFSIDEVYYGVPEPTTLSLCAIASMTLLRRRPG